MTQEIVSILQEARTVVLSTHTRPDGDAVGSVLGLGLYLQAKGKEVSIINHDPPSSNMDWLEGLDMLETFDGSLSQRERIQHADLRIVLDTNAENRLGSVGPVFRNAGGPCILIDHHTGPEDWFTTVFRDERASSTGELIFRILTGWDLDEISSDIATALYVAIMTDTGSFRFSNVTPAVHRIIADLIERGSLDPAVIHTAIFDRRSVEGLRLLSRVLDTLTITHAGQVGYMAITRRMLNEIGVNIEEADGFVNYILSVEGVRVAMLFTETERGTKVSFRSRLDDHVHRWAQSLGGGGHRNASGAFLKKSLDETIEIAVRGAEKFIVLKDQGEHAKEDLSEDDTEYLASLLHMQTQKPAK